VYYDAIELLMLRFIAITKYVLFLAIDLSIAIVKNLADATPEWHSTYVSFV
jgi:hypothetical protein